MRSPHSRIRYWLCECWSAWSRLVNLIEIKSSWIQIREQNYQSLKVAFLTLNILELHSSLDDLVSCYEIWPQQPPSRLVPLLVCFKLKCHALSCLTFRSSGAAVLGSSGRWQVHACSGPSHAHHQYPPVMFEYWRYWSPDTPTDPIKVMNSE